MREYDIFQVNDLHKMKKSNIPKYAECAALAYQNYPLFDYLLNGEYDYEIVKKLFQHQFTQCQIKS